MQNRQTESSRNMIKLFVYGTLKQGFSNHEQYCKGVKGVEPGTVTGRIYQLKAGYPAIEVPRKSILAHGTSDPASDLAKLQEIDNLLRQNSLPFTAMDCAIGEKWGVVYGEILSFDTPEEVLPKIDILECFRPGRASLYKRVIVIAMDLKGNPVPVWVYVGDLAMKTRTQRLEDGHWP